MKRILITGTSGFLGRELAKGLSFNYEVTRLGRSGSDDINQDIAIPFELNSKYDCVIHAAGKAHSVPKSQKEIDEFYRVNLEGTKNLLQALKSYPPSKFIFISSVAVYGCDSGFLINESINTNPLTPYAKSKELAEKEVEIWCQQNKCEHYILRLPLIAGLNPPGNLKAMYNSIKKGYYFRIGSGKARKSMVGTSDIVELIPKLEANSGTYNLTDGHNPCIAEIDNYIANSLNKRIRQIPSVFVEFVAIIGGFLPGFPLDRVKYRKLISELTFSDQKARDILSWNPKPALESLKFSNKT